MNEQTNFKNIRTIAKKELKSFFDYPFAYILLMIFTGFSFYFYLSGIFLLEEASLRGYFEIIPWFLLFYIPAITMRSLAQEKKEGTFELIISQPISELDYLLGKYLGNLIFIFVTFLATLSLPITLMIIGQPDVGVMAGQYFGVLMFASALAAIGVWISSSTKNQTIAFMVSVLIIALLIVSGLDVLITSATYPLNIILAEISILNHFENMTRGVINIKDIFYFLALIIISLSMSYLTFIRQKFGAHSGTYGRSKLRAVLILIFSGVLIFSGNYISIRFDLTENKLYSLSDGSKKVVAKIPKPLTVELYMSRELPSQAQLISRDVKDMLKDYESYSRGKIRIVYRDPDNSESDLKEAQNAGIRTVQFNVLKENEYQVKQAYFSMLFKYGDQKEIFPIGNNTLDLEYGLTSLIHQMTTENKPEIWFLTGHGEKVLGDDYKEILPELLKRYLVQTKDFSSADPRIPASIDALIIPGTKTDIPKDEQEVIETYLKNGGKVFFLVDAVNVVPDLVMGVTQKNNIGDILNRYGVTVGNDLVMDIRSHEAVNFTVNNANVIINYPFWIRAQTAGDLILNKGVDSLLLPWASSVTVDQSKLKGAKATVIYQTSDQGSVQIAQFSNTGQNDPSTAGLGQFNINPVENPSFISGTARRVPVAVVVDGSAPGSSNPDLKGRMIVIGDSDFATSEYLNNPNAVSNFIFFLNAVDWLAQDDSLISIRSKNSTPRGIEDLSNSQKNIVKYANLAGIPLIIAMLGLLRYQRRRQKMHWRIEFREDPGDIET